MFMNANKIYDLTKFLSEFNINTFVESGKCFIEIDQVKDITLKELFVKLHGNGYCFDQEGNRIVIEKLTVEYDPL